MGRGPQEGPGEDHSPFCATPEQTMELRQKLQDSSAELDQLRSEPPHLPPSLPKAGPLAGRADTAQVPDGQACTWVPWPSQDSDGQGVDFWGDWVAPVPSGNRTGS